MNVIFNRSNVYLYIFLIFLVFPIYQSFCQETTNYDYLLLPQPRTFNKIESLHVSDLNQDQKDEFVVKVQQSGAVCAIRVYENDLSTVRYQKEFQKDIIYIHSVNWDQKGFEEILLIEKEDKWINLLLLSYENKDDTLAFWQLLSLDKYGDAVQLKYPIYLDINEDGFEDIIFAINSGLDPIFRGIWALDVKNKQRLWDFPTAVNIGMMELKSFPGKTNPYLLISTKSTDQIFPVKNMDDQHSYAIVLDAHSGDPLLQEEMGGIRSHTLVKYFNKNDSTNIELLIAVSSQDIKKDEKIILWDFDNEKKLHELPILKFDEKIHIADIDNNGTNELVRSGSDNEIIFYDENLEESNRFPIEGGKVRVEQIVDLDRDGYLEYIVSRNRSSIFILNRKNEIVAEKDFYGDIILPINQGVEHDYGLGIYDYKIGKFDIFDLERNWMKVENDLKVLTWGGALGILLSLLVFSLVYLRSRRKNWLNHDRSIWQNLSQFMLISDKNGKVIFCNHQMEKFLGLHKSQITERPLLQVLSAFDGNIDLKKSQDGKFWENQDLEMNIKEKDHPRKILLKINQHWKKQQFKGYIVTAEDLTTKDLYKQTISWASMAQRLAHEIKNPLTTVKLSLQRLKMEYETEKAAKRSKYDTYVDSSLDEITRLRKVSENFMKLAQVEKPVKTTIQLNKVISKVLSKYQIVIPDSIKLMFDPNEDLSEIKADPDQIETLLSNLIDNAVKAINTKGHIEIRAQTIHRIEMNQAIDQIQLEIEDDGEGIPEDKLETIFEPHISGEGSGTGLGLMIVKKIVEDHQGKITINSKKSVGTVVSIELPINDKK